MTQPIKEHAYMSPIVANVITYADGFGRWRARVEFVHALSESDTRQQYNLARQWPTIRRRARRAIVNQIADRERKTHESRAAAVRRVRTALEPLGVIKQHMDASNRWHGVTLGEP